MGYFPMCIKLEGRKVALVGNGSQIKDKEEKLNPFGAVMMHCTVAELCDTEIPAKKRAGRIRSERV